MAARRRLSEVVARPPCSLAYAPMALRPRTCSSRRGARARSRSRHARAGLRLARGALAGRVGVPGLHGPAAADGDRLTDRLATLGNPRAGGDDRAGADGAIALARGRPRMALLVAGAARPDERLQPAAQGAAGLPALRRAGRRRARGAGGVPERARHRRHGAGASRWCWWCRRGCGRWPRWWARRSRSACRSRSSRSGWHFPSDVIGGFLLATGWALVLLAGLRALDARYPERAGRSRAGRGAAGRWWTRVAGAGLVVALVVGGASRWSVVALGHRAVPAARPGRLRRRPHRVLSWWRRGWP